MKNSTNVYDIITEKISSLLTESLTYSRKWSLTSNGVAINGKTNHVYDGINQILLSYYLEKGKFKVNKWLTFLQSGELGGKISKGEKALPVIKFSYYFTLKTNKSVTISLENFDLLSNQEKLNYKRCSFLKLYYVFNVSQIENLPEELYQIEDLQLNQFKPVEECEMLSHNYISNSQVSLVHVAQSKAFYRPFSDSIVMPLREQFDTSNAYYKTLFHEITHSTGHLKRLNRKSSIEFSETSNHLEAYALEELVAELGTAFINSKFGIDTELSNNSAYIQSWLKALKNDNKFFITACGLAQKAANYVFQVADSKSLAA